jgi:hypothetical protein
VFIAGVRGGATVKHCTALHCAAVSTLWYRRQVRGFLGLDDSIGYGSEARNDAWETRFRVVFKRGRTACGYEKCECEASPTRSLKQSGIPSVFDSYRWVRYGIYVSPPQKVCARLVTISG